MNILLQKIKFYWGKLKYILRETRLYWAGVIYWSIYRIFEKPLTDSDTRNIPIIINCFNRLNCLEILINRLTQDGYTNIHLLDNNSTYPPLLEYYKHTPYPVYRLDRNIGFLALWNCEVWNKFKNKYYVYTDPDVVPADGCPDDYLHKFYLHLRKNPQLDKVGFSLQIDNLPDHYDKKEAVLKIESPFWKKPINPELYNASIDTTFALYRPGIKGGFWLRAGRTAPPYSALHLPWYQNSQQPDEETLYYRSLYVYSQNWS
jgi:hypothetical protein